MFTWKINSTCKKISKLKNNLKIRAGTIVDHSVRC